MVNSPKWGKFSQLSLQISPFFGDFTTGITASALLSHPIMSQALTYAKSISFSGLSSKLTDFLDDTLYLHLRNRIIRILPQHWIDRIVNIITFQAGKYKGSDIAKMCTLNGKQFSSLAEMAVYVCDQAFDNSVQEEEASRAARALNQIFHGEFYFD